MNKRDPLDRFLNAPPPPSCWPRSGASARRCSPSSGGRWRGCSTWRGCSRDGPDGGQRHTERAQFTSRQIEEAIKDYLERGSAFHYPGEAGRASALYEAAEGILCIVSIVSQGHQLTLCVPGDVGVEDGG